MSDLPERRRPHNDIGARIGDVTGIILAGGKSLRYGRDKALEVFQGTTLVQRVVEALEPLFKNLVVITNDPERFAHLNLPMDEDLIKDLGPIGGIYTGLMKMVTDTGFFVACDMPFLNVDLIKYMTGLRQGFDVVIPRVSGNTEALHALYHRRCLPAIERLIQAEIFQIFQFFDRVHVRYVDEKEIRLFDPRLRSFVNINRPQELRDAEKMLTK